jgi:uncharacterized protein YdcH (DUF465 family)
LKQYKGDAMYNLRRSFLFIILMMATSSLLIIGAKDISDYRDDVDENIAYLEQSNEELSAKLVSVGEQVDELIEYHRQRLEGKQQEFAQLGDDQGERKTEMRLDMAVDELFFDLLVNFRDIGLSRTKYPDLIITEELPGWLEQLGKSGDLGWNKGGLDQLSVLAGIYYIRNHIANNNMLMDLLKSKREYGMSDGEYENYKREWKLLSRPTAGISPYNHNSEGDGLSSHGVFAYQLYPLVKIYDRVELPAPGTAEYWEVLEDSLYCLQSKGVDIDRILDFHNSLSERIRHLEPADTGAGFLESIGFEGERDADEVADITSWRARLLQASYAHLLKMVRTCDAGEVAEGLRRQANAIQAFDEALAVSADAVVTEIQANQKLIEDILSEIPMVGDAMSLYSVLSGETLSGEEIKGWKRIIDAIMGFGPIGLQGAMKASPSVTRMVESLQSVLNGATKAQLETLSRTLHVSVEDLVDLGTFIMGTMA